MLNHLMCPEDFVEFPGLRLTFRAASCHCSGCVLHKGAKLKRPGRVNPACPCLPGHVPQSCLEGEPFLKCTSIIQANGGLEYKGPQEMKQDRRERWIKRGFILAAKRRQQQMLLLPAQHHLTPPDFSTPVVGSSWLLPMSLTHLSLCFPFSKAWKCLPLPIAQKQRGVDTPRSTFNLQDQGSVGTCQAPQIIRSCSLQ